jgi:hypothetical protein
MAPPKKKPALADEDTTEAVSSKATNADADGLNVEVRKWAVDYTKTVPFKFIKQPANVWIVEHF